MHNFFTRGEFFDYNRRLLKDFKDRRSKNAGIIPRATPERNRECFTRAIEATNCSILFCGDENEGDEFINNLDLKVSELYNKVAKYT